MELIFATNNKNKLIELREMMMHSGFELQSLADIHVDIEVLEDGQTFEENAIKKAVEIARLTGKLTLADDSGLEIDFLDKLPGVHSARFMGSAPYIEKNTKILELLEGVPFEKRTARFVCVIAAALPCESGIRTIVERGAMEGYIHSKIDGENGFGYDPIFYLPEFRMTTGILLPEQKNRVSHRGKAMRQMSSRLKQFIEAGC